MADLVAAREVAQRVLDRQLHARMDEVLTLVTAVLELTKPAPEPASKPAAVTAVDGYQLAGNPYDAMGGAM